MLPVNDTLDMRDTGGGHVYISNTKIRMPDGRLTEFLRRENMGDHLDSYIEKTQVVRDRVVRRSAQVQG